jgi:uncharacterized protein YneF (UPF0154 family)
MNIGLTQIAFIILICFLLFGNFGNIFLNLKFFFDKLKEILNTNK